MLVYDDAGSLENRYLWGPATDQFFADEDALGEVLWGLTDHQGTVRDLVEYDAATDTTSVVNHVEYDSFGNITAQSNSAEQPLLAFTGRYFDEDVGLQWNWQRWYEAATALWLSPDPIGFASGDTNLYRYVGNDPVNRIDPSGLEDREITVRQGWSPGMIARYEADIAAQARRRAGDGTATEPSDSYGPSLWNDVKLVIRYPGQAYQGLGQGYVDGSMMVNNALTLGQIDSWNNYVNDVVERNGGAYTAAYYSSWVGAGSLYAAGGLYGAEYYLGITQLGSSAVGRELLVQAKLEIIYLLAFGEFYRSGPSADDIPLPRPPQFPRWRPPGSGPQPPRGGNPPSGWQPPPPGAGRDFPPGTRPLPPFRPPGPPSLN